MYQPGDWHYVRENYQITGWDFEDGECILKYADDVVLSMGMGEDGEDATKWNDWLEKKVWDLEGNGYFKCPVTDPESLGDDEVFVRTDKAMPFTPGIHLPKWGSRIWNEVIICRPEQIQNITEEDAVKEGMAIIPDPAGYDLPSAKLKFNLLWNDMHPGSWAKNDWVWVTEFKQLSTEGKPLFKKLEDINAEVL